MDEQARAERMIRFNTIGAVFFWLALVASAWLITQGVLPGEPRGVILLAFLFVMAVTMTLVSWLARRERAHRRPTGRPG